MNKSDFTFYIEINEFDYIFYIGENDEEKNFKILYEYKVPLNGIQNSRISDANIVLNTIKKNIYFIEHKLNYTFKEVVIILDNFNPTFINLTGFKRLNGSQVLKENITYILNTLKSSIDQIEIKKIVLHIFNSRFFLDKKEMINLPIGLFGDFYTHELSFTLMCKNNYKSLKGIFDRCNLKIKKIFIKSFVLGVNISDRHKNNTTFFHIKINENSSKIFYFENNSLKYEQNFEFGTNIIIKDMSKIISLNTEVIKNILDKIELSSNFAEDDFIEEKFFNKKVYRKIKKKLIYEIALARINEISDIMLFKNINLRYFDKLPKTIFFDIEDKTYFKCFEKIYKKTFSMNGSNVINFINSVSSADMLSSANKLVNFGWKKEAIPFFKSKKSLIAKLFETIFG
tara:strand:- start:2180 stop:3376 length:1197 start_codon:yes stop_codon:yes gene_type:complete